MKNSIKTGLGFGLTSGIITTIGLMIGLYAGTKSIAVIVGGIFVIAIADSLSDAMGIHMVTEVDRKNSHRQIWESTISTFLFKLISTLSFIIPFLFLQVSTAIIVGIVWGVTLISVFSYYIAISKKKSPYRTIAEHLFITFIVIILTYHLGKIINAYFS